MSFRQASIAAQLIAEINKKLEQEQLYVDQILEKTREVVRNLYHNWFSPLPLEKRPPVGFILGGLDENLETKAFYLTSRYDFAPQLCTSKVAMGGIPQYVSQFLFHSEIILRRKLL